MPTYADRINSWVSPAAFEPSATFRAGNGYSPHHVNCSADPKDLRPPAEMILDCAVYLRQNTDPATPLVIPMGENHPLATHIALQRLVLAGAVRLFGRENVFMGFEQPHNHFAMVMREDVGRDVPKGLFYTPRRYDPDGRAVLAGFLGYRMPRVAPTARLDLMAFCYHEGIRTAFVDAARIKDLVPGGYVLDPDDPQTARHAREITDAPKLIDAASSDGSAARNGIIVENTLEPPGGAAALPPGQVLILGMGGAHVFGDHADNMQYEDSLDARFRAAGAAVLPVFITSRCNRYGLNVLSPAAQAALPRAVPIDGVMEDITFSMYDPVARKYFIPPEDKDALREIYQRSAMPGAFYDVDADRGPYQRDAHNFADAMLAAYAAETPALSAPAL